MFCFSLFSGAQTGDAVRLKLMPAPKEVRRAEGSFVVRPPTKVLISDAEDKLAAQTLQQEIRERAGITLAIESTPFTPQARGHIFLGRLTGRRMQAYLEAQGVKPGAELGDQGYVIRATETGVIVAAPTAQGLFYGVQTLRQLLHEEGWPGFAPRSGANLGLSDKERRAADKAPQLAVPAVTIRDWPSMQWRGVSDDISRGPIPTLDYLKLQIRTLAEYKINLLGFNMEHVFDFASQPLVAPKGAALTSAEIKELIAYAGKYFITLLPEQQAFGHLHQFLKYEVYSDMAETPHGHVLTPANPQNYDFIRQVYGEIAPLFPGPFFHIGSDETIELGMDRTKALAGQKGLGRVYLEHLQKVYEIMQPYHKQLMFWGDIAVKYPELLTMLPKDMIAVPWDYDPQANYEKTITPYTNAGLRVLVAPGAQNWGVIWPDQNAAFLNIRNFARDGQKHQALGLLNTTWCDDGESLLEMTWPALVFGAAAGWQPGESSIDDFKASYDWAFYRNDDATFKDVLENLDRPHALLKALKDDNAGNELFWSDPFSKDGQARAAADLPAMHDLRLSAEHAVESLQRNRSKAKVHGDTLDDMLFAAWRLDTLGMKIQFTNEISRFYWDAYQNQSDAARVQHDFDVIVDINGRLESLRDAITGLKKPYADAWAREYHSYWLENVLVRYDNLAREIQQKIVAVLEAQRQFGTAKTLSPPEQLGFYTKP
jgi:hypothetical protein